MMFGGSLPPHMSPILEGRSAYSYVDCSVRNRHFGYHIGDVE